MSEDEKNELTAPALGELSADEQDIQDELSKITATAAKKYFLLADIIVEDLDVEEVKAASRLNSKEAPMFMHMVKDFMSAQIKTNARDKAEKRAVHINIGTVNLPPRRKLEDTEVIEVEAKEIDE